MISHWKKWLRKADAIDSPVPAAEEECVDSAEGMSSQTVTPSPIDSQIP